MFITTRWPSASLQIKDLATKYTTVKWPIMLYPSVLFFFCFLLFGKLSKILPNFWRRNWNFCKETNWYDRDTYIYFLMNPPLPFIWIQPDTVYITANPWQFITTNSLVYSPVTWLDQGLLHQWLNSWPKRLQFAKQIPILFTDSKHRQLGIVKIPIMNISFVWTGYGAI